MKKLELERLFERIRKINPRRFSLTIENKAEGHVQAALSTNIDGKPVVIRYEEETEYAVLDPAGGGKDDIKRSYYTLKLREGEKLRSYSISDSVAGYIHEVLINRGVIFPEPWAPLGRIGDCGGF